MYPDLHVYLDILRIRSYGHINSACNTFWST